MRIVARRSVIVLAASAALGLAACSSGGGETGPEAGLHTVAVIMDDAKITPDRIAAAPGETLRVVATNTGKMQHALVFEIPGNIQSLGHALNPGETAEMKLTVPNRPGAYDFVSPVGEDRKKGITGALVVAQPGVMPPQPGATPQQPGGEQPQQ
jgi:uncharacterized cupredoxin-like copper-binding protein